MSSKQQHIKSIQEAYAEVMQSAEHAQFWHKRWLEENQRQFQTEIARLKNNLEEAKKIFQQEETRFQRVCDQTLDEADKVLEDRHQEIAQNARYAVEKLGILGAPWDSPLWNDYHPSLRHNNLQPDPRTGQVPTAGGYGHTQDVPGGVRVGVVIQDLGRPLKDIPLLLPLVGKKHLVIVSGNASKNAALHLLQSLVTRIVLTYPTLAARFIFLDPLGLGVNFPFTRLSETIRGNKVYNETEDIRSRMREITEHMANIQQRYLMREYDDIEAYNRDAQELVEPYRFVCIADFPAKFDPDAVERLLSVADQGIRRGVYFLIHVNTDLPNMPRDFSNILDSLKKNAHFIDASDQEFKITLNANSYAFTPDSPPSNALFNTMVDRVNKETEKGGFKGISFEKIMVPEGAEWQGDSAELIDIPLGKTGARDTLNFWLGQRKDGRIASHALIGGQTGSGKSTLLHVLITSLALRYSPQEVRLMLLDFKEGVEFKPYADYALPHVDVIAIESEREFALSVLRNLHAELERRGKLFKEANAVKLQEYREKTGQQMPRVILIIDEFQVIFNAKDSLNDKAVRIVEDLAKRGRAFGIHMILASQSVRVSELREAFNQFQTRIALKSPVDDIAAVLGANNTAEAALLERSGQVILNDDSGRPDRNLLGQVAILDDKQALPRILNYIRDEQQARGYQRQKPLTIFRGNELSHLNENLSLRELYEAIQSSGEWLPASVIKDRFKLREWYATDMPALAWVGEALEIKPHTAVAFRSRGQSNLLVIGSNEEMIFGMLGGIFLSLAAFYSPGTILYRIIDLSQKEEAWEDTCEDFEDAFPYHDIRLSERAYATKILDEVHDTLKKRQEQSRNGQEKFDSVIYLIVGSAHRLSALIPVPSRLGGRDEPSEYARKVLDILQHGPELGIHAVMSFENRQKFDSMLGKGALALFSQRILLPMSKDDSHYFTGEDAAASLGHYRALLMDNEGSTAFEKFKPYALPADRQDRHDLFSTYGERLTPSDWVNPDTQEQ